MSETIGPEQTILAYRYGIFPWYSDEDPILWWYTDPRSVLFPSELRISKSLRSLLNKDHLTVTFDKAFDDVIRNCQSIDRPGQESTWIQEETIWNFNMLHEMGYAHSVEIWEREELVGGLYGLAIGKIFYGESMFSITSNASKVAFVRLVRHLHDQGFELIDCQQETEHLNSLGARNISGLAFFDHLRSNLLFCLDNGDHQF